LVTSGNAKWLSYKIQIIYLLGAINYIEIYTWNVLDAIYYVYIYTLNILGAIHNFFLSSGAIYVYPEKLDGKKKFYSEQYYI